MSSLRKFTFAPSLALIGIGLSGSPGASVIDDGERGDHGHWR